MREADEFYADMRKSFNIVQDDLDELSRVVAPTEVVGRVCDAFILIQEPQRYRRDEPSHEDFKLFVKA